MRLCVPRMLERQKRKGGSANGCGVGKNDRRAPRRFQEALPAKLLGASRRSILPSFAAYSVQRTSEGMAAEAILTGACNGAVFNKSDASTNCSHVEARRLLIKQPHGDLEYFSKEPADPSLQWQDHFTSLLLSADYFNTSRVRVS